MSTTSKSRSASIERVAFTFEEVAAKMGKHRSWVYRQVSKGSIIPIKGFGTAMISQAELDRILSGGAER